MKKCPNGMYSEIKYDGERVQVHKNGDHFSYFSRSLKPVLPHKVSKKTLFEYDPVQSKSFADFECLLMDQGIKERWSNNKSLKTVVQHGQE